MLQGVGSPLTSKHDDFYTTLTLTLLDVLLFNDESSSASEKKKSIRFIRLAEDLEILS